MVWAESIKRLRRYLRDPAPGQIWADEDLRLYFNDAMFEIAQKVGPIVRVEGYNYPPEYEYSYTWDWEVQYGAGTQHQCLTVNQSDGWVITFPWESAYWLDTAPSADDGYRDTHPWESVLSTPADVVPIPLHGRFHKAKIICYDEEPLDGIDEHELARRDGYYRSRVGKPSHYYRLDDLQNRLVLYPAPSPVWEETERYEILGDTGGLITNEGWLDNQTDGQAGAVVPTTDTLLAIYEAMPEPVQNMQDVPDLARFMVKYAEYGALERAYGADTDGFIPSLRDYWALRKKVGIEALKKFKRLSLTGRNYRFGGTLPMTRGRTLRLPEHYPAV